MYYKQQSPEELRRYTELYAKLSRNGVLLYAGHLLAQAAAWYPKRTALIVAPDTIITYEQLFQEACKVSNYMLEKGIKPRDKVIIFVENSPLFYAAYYGCWQLGAIVVPLNTFLEQHEIAHIIADAQASYIIVSEKLKSKLEGIENLPPLFEVAELCKHPNSTTPALQALSPKEIAILLYTSGTTGMPKGVALCSESIIINVAQGIARFNFVEKERVLCPLPLFHSFTQNTCVWSSIIAGAAVILVPKITRVNLKEAIAQRPTIVLGIPGLYGIFCKLKGISFPNVRYFISGGEALASNIRRYFALRFGRMIANGYGLTEAGPVVSVDLADYWKPTHTIGKPIVHLKCETRGEEGSKIGELWVSGKNLMLGYYNAPEATEKIIQNGWLNTGDLATINPDGSLVICGREKDIIIQKGIKIYPQEIETALATHTAVLLAAVIGEADPRDGEYPVAYVQLTEGATVSPQELQKYCKERLAPYKIPDKVYIIDRMPMTATGKIDKKKLRLNKET